MAELRAPAAELAQVSLGSHLAALKAVYDAALGAGQYGAAVAAEVARGKACGIYVVKVEAAGKIKLGPDWRALIGNKSDDVDSPAQRSQRLRRGRNHCRELVDKAQQHLNKN